MTNVASYFRERPFVVRAGKLDPSLGDGRYMTYGSPLQLKGLVESTFGLPVSFRLVFGPYGSGKTWTFAWLWREFSQESGPAKCLVLGVPRWEIRKAPERSMVESIIKCVLERYPHIFPIGSAAGAATASSNLLALRNHLENPDARQILIGQSSKSRVPSTSTARSFSMNSLEDLTDIVLATLEAARLSGYRRSLILADEFEAAFLLTSSRNQKILSEFLRGLYDSLQGPHTGQTKYAHTQCLFGGTYPVFKEFAPGLVSKTSESSSVLQAFIRRAETPFELLSPSDQELTKLARLEIARTRRKPEDSLIPFNEDALLNAWKNSALNIGEFIHIVSDMYALAESESTTRVTVDHLKKVLASYNSDQ